MQRTIYGLAALALAWLGAPGGAAAQTTCFDVDGRGARGQAVVGLHEVVRFSASCAYSVSPDGPFVAPAGVSGRDSDFLELYQQLAAGRTDTADPRAILARPTGRRGQVQTQTLILRYCAHYLIEEQLGFQVVPEAAAGNLRVERAARPSCDAETLELRAVAGARVERLHRGAAEHTLGTAQRTLLLPVGDWSIYAARPGGAVGLRVGVFRSQRVVTPLQNHLRTVHLAESGQGEGAPPLLAARWDSGAPGLLLHPTAHAVGAELLWPELRTAADAGFLWVARTVSDGPPLVLGTVQLEATDPAAIRLPDSVVREQMRARYGEAGDALAPSTEDWNAIFDDLAICLTPSYHDGRTAAIGAPVPDAGACASLQHLSVYAQADAARPSGPRYCVQHAMQEITARGVRQEFGEPECFSLPAPGSAHRPPVRIAVAGDRFTLEGDGLCVLIDGAASTPEEDGTHVLRSGLLEVRESGGLECTSRQAVGRLRLPVIDPEREWHPVGLYTGGDEDTMRCSEEGDAVCPWRSIAHDERSTFAFIEARHELDFSLSTSGQVAAVQNRDPSRPVQLTQDVPVLSGVSGRFEGPPEPAVVAYVSRDSACPNDLPYRELRERPPVDVDELLIDATFHVFLLAVEEPDDPASCLARASFRTRSSRALVAETVEDFLGLEVGLLGDTQAVFFANDPIALGVALPLVWFRMTPGIRFVALEIAGNLVMSAAFDPAELSRVGVALSWALSFGIPEYLPRILSVGGMLHGAAETSTIDNPVISFYVGLNLATLIDLAGGR